MRLGGLQKMTLLDFPGRVACTVFTQGCNFRCPFCHNSALVGAIHESPVGDAAEDGGRAALAPAEFPQEEFFRFLEKRRGLLDGVAITGGEPLLHADAADFIRRIRSLGYAVKLDTNGAFPERLRAIIDEGLVDYVAVDIKNSPEKYAMTAGAEGFLPQVEETVRLLKENRVNYEFRTTLVDELHEVSDFEQIGRWIEGAPRYFIQQFVDSGAILGGTFNPAGKEKTQACLAAMQRYVPNAAIRGQD